MNKLQSEWDIHQKKKAIDFCRSLSGDAPVIILGVQKSGTTAISALLAQAVGKDATLDVLRSIRHPEWKVLIQYGIGSFEEYIYKYRESFKKEIIKEPGLTFFYKELSRVFPRAKFVMIVRHPMDNIRSILNRLRVPGDLETLDIESYPLVKESPAWRINLDTRWMGYVASNYVDALAYRWKVGARTYLENKENFVLLKYEDFLINKDAYVKQLANEVGLQVNNDISAFLDKQYQSKGNSKIDTKCFFAENYQTIKRMCSKEAELLGYDM
ncbi:MAG: sulfotransferase [Alcanivorax sp.]|nr:sulfotransferase [Alcanivorax sp.]